MKTNFLILFTLLGIMASCQQKEMKVSRSNFSVVTELTDASKAYISKNENGKIKLNRNNLIGNTDWVVSIERTLTLEEIGPSLQKLTKKKFNVGSMHEDTKQVYLVYSDTLHKQNAYVKMPFISIALGEPPVYELSEGVESFMINSVADVKDFLPLKDTHTYLVSINKKITTEHFVNILIELEKKKMSERINGEVYIY